MTHLSKKYPLTSITRQVFFTAFVLCILRLFKLKTEGQTKTKTKNEKNDIQKTPPQSYKLK